VLEYCTSNLMLRISRLLFVLSVSSSSELDYRALYDDH